MATPTPECTTALADYHSNTPVMGLDTTRGFAIAAKVLVQLKNLSRMGHFWIYFLGGLDF
jgi:hypothetical protein